MKKIIIAFVLSITLIAAIAVYRAFNHYEDTQYYPEQSAVPVTMDEQAVIERFSGGIQIPTISKDNLDEFDPQPFLTFHQYLSDSYPHITQFAERTLVNDYSLVYKFPGSDTSLKPILFMGHMDVVSVDAITMDAWSHDPFAGVVDDEFVWGRGAIDDKATVMALMEAMELQLTNGYQPKRTIYFSFGHDEEVGGSRGAARVASYFEQQGVKFEFVLDEGGAITSGIMPAVEQPVAIIGVAEKGFVNLRLSVEQSGGHSSTPPDHTGVGILSEAIVALEANQFSPSLEFTNQTFESIGYFTDFGTRLAMANQWLLGPVIESTLLKNPKSAASLRTTIAATMFEGSSKSNILPTKTTAVVNFRILPGETWQSVKQRVIEVINDPRVQVEEFMNNNPSQVSSTDSWGFKLISETIREFDSQVLVAPYLVQGGTDAKYFYPVSDSIYRFLMVRIDKELINTMHGIDERIRKQDYVAAVQYFYEIFNKVNR